MQKWLAPVGRILYAIGLGSIGLMHFFYLNFPWVVIPDFPGWLPFRLLWIFVIGLALMVAGVCILFNLKGRQVAAWTGVGLLTLVVVAHVPNQLRGQYAAVLGAWTNTLKEMSLAGGAWIAALSLADDDSRLPAWLERSLPAGRYMFGTMLAIFGFDHFLYPQFVASLIPSWIGAQMFWTYFAGSALIAGGLGIMVRRVAKPASLLTGVMIFLWVPMLHIPRAIVDPYTNVGNEWASVWEALAFSGMAWMLTVIEQQQ
ncbi:hypothetical protein [Edaphobacter sp. 12200R-103]|uniref:hypothetical protein n=1 Tax=Edaphobacter sp. 12200R-103 TaxID=2703788 RepID=UPI00138D54E8|nr:hypothetical protein [Edaphobacter sp. 12200R-103]QHS52338.1 hypothetical protein GWR55_11840 [Edaphobacter sp. 12200R-103]